MTKYINWIKGSCVFDAENDLRKMDMELTPEFVKLLDSMCVKTVPCARYGVIVPGVGDNSIRMRYRVKRELSKYCEDVFNSQYGEFFNKKQIDDASTKRTIYFNNYNEYIRALDIIKSLIDYCIKAECEMKKSATVEFRTEVDDEE